MRELAGVELEQVSGGNPIAGALIGAGTYITHVLMTDQEWSWAGFASTTVGGIFTGGFGALGAGAIYSGIMGALGGGAAYNAVWHYENVMSC